MLPRLTTLEAIEAAVWQELGRAVVDRHHEWRTPVLATVDSDAADARTVVLRGVDATERRILVYTDARAGKVAQLAARPQATLVMWSKRLGWQLRCRAHCEVQQEGLAVSSRWASVKLSPSAQDYLSPLPPGTPLEGAAPALEHREYFAMISARVTRVDWLELHRDGHRRAAFGADFEPRWLQP